MLDGYAPHVDLGTEVDRQPAISRLALVTAVVQWLGVLRGMIMLGVTSAIFMIIGLLSLPGVLVGIDDPQLAPWYVNAGLLSWMGTYLLYPAWCLWLSRRYGG